MFDYSRLKGRIAEKNQTYRSVAKAMGITPVTFGARINTGRGFYAEQIMAACKLLDISDDNIHSFFYAH